MAGFSDFEDPTMVTGIADHILVWAGLVGFKAYTSTT